MSEFEKYMDEQIPTWRTDVSIELIQELKELYTKVVEYQKTIDGIFNMSFNHNSAGVDYSNDLQKNQTKLIELKSELQRNIDGIKSVVYPQEESENAKAFK